MRIRSFLTSTAIVTAFLIAGPHAMAQKGGLLSPSSDWAVTSVADNTGAGGGYCALARRFTKDMIVTIARNENGETSLALDFQRPLLSTAGPMSVTLDPGAGQQRVYDVKPVSSKAMVVRLGNDKAFFKALEKTGYLRVEAGNNSYSFNLADIDTGQGKLDACIAAMVMPAAGDESLTPEPVQQARSGFAPSMGAEVNALRQQVEALKAENERISGMITQGTAPPVAANTAALDALNSRVAALESENEGLRANLQEAKASQVKTVRDESVQAQIDSLKAENASLQAQLQTGGTDDAASLQAEIERLTTENSNLKAIADAAAKEQPAGAAADQSLVVSLTEQNRKLQEQLDAMAKSGAEGAELTSRIAALEAENATLKNELTQASQGAADDSTQKIAALKEENQRLQKALEEQQKTQSLAGDISGQIEALQSQNAELQKKLEVAQIDTRAGYDAEIAKYKSEIETLKAEADKKTVDDSLLEQLRQQIGEMENENRMLQEAADKSQQDFAAQKQIEIDALKALAEGKSKESQDAVTKMQQTIAELSAKIEAKDKEIVAAGEKLVELEALKAKNTELEQTIAAGSTEQQKASGELQQKIAALETENADLKKAAVSSQELASLKAENEKLKTAAQEQTASAGLADAASKAEIDKLKAENAGLLARVNAGDAKVSEELKTALADNERLKAEAQKAASLQTEMDTLRKENDELKLAASVQKEPPPAPDPQLSELMAENSRLKDQLAAQSAAAAAPEGLEELKTANKDLSVSLEEALARAESLQTQVAEKDKELASAINEKQELLASLSEKGGEHADAALLKGELESLKTENQTLKDKIAQLEQAPVTVAALQKTIEGLTADNQKLKADLDEVKTKLETVTAAAAPEPEPEAAKPEQAAEVAAAEPEQEPAPDQAQEQRIAELEQKLHEEAREAPQSEEPKAEEARAEEPALAAAPVPESKPARNQEEAPEQLLPAEQASLDGAPYDPSKPVVSGEDVSSEDLLQADIRSLEKPEATAEPVAEAAAATPAPEVAAAAQAAAEPAVDRTAEDLPEPLNGRYTEAQMQEMALSRAIRDGVETARAEEPKPSADTAAIETAPGPDAVEAKRVGSDLQPVIVSRSEDPFAAIDAGDQPVRYESREGQPVRAETASNATMEASELDGRIDREENNAAAQEASAVASQAAPEEIIAAGAQQPLTADATEISGLLSNAQVVAQNEVQFVEKVSDAQRKVYQWRTAENLYGSAEQQKLQDEGQFDNRVLAYLEKTEKRCKGDFAIVPDGSEQYGPTRIDSYEVACVGKDVNSAASLLFYNQGDVFTAVAHEAPADQMESAMNIRDRLVKALAALRVSSL